MSTARPSLSLSSKVPVWFSSVSEYGLVLTPGGLCADRDSSDDEGEDESMESAEDDE
jgi:hypothetical protein